MTSRPGPSAHLRIGDAEREAAVSALGEHYAAGRITREELDDRTSAAYAARTEAELWPLFADLPVAARPTRGGSTRTAGRPAGPPRWFPGALVPLMLVAIALAVLTHLPWPILLIVGWIWWGRMFRHWRGQTSGSRRDVRGTWV
jgi:hypothetical protein